MEHPKLSLPVPDPTLLTTEQLLRESAALKELLFTRLDAMDKAIVLFNENLTRAPTEVDKQIAHLKELIMERFESNKVKFESIQTQFHERDTRTEQNSTDSKVAVNAALQAAKELLVEQNKSSSIAIAKSEGSTTKQIDQIAVLIQTTSSASNDKIDDMKTRISALESRILVKSENTTSNQWIVGLVIGSLIALFALFWKR